MTSDKTDLKKIYLCVCARVCVSAGVCVCIWRLPVGRWLQRLEEGVGSPGAGVIGSVSHHMGAGNQRQILWNKYF